MQNPLVTVVVPVYNTISSFVTECIDSICAQTYENIEVIIVDDGSKYECANFLDNLISDEKYGRRIRIYHKSNGGVSSARNYGIDKAQGEYICFVDADDIVHKKYVEALLSACLEQDCKAAVCVLEQVTSVQGKTDVTYRSYDSHVAEGIDIWKRLNTGWVTSKLFHKTIFKDIRFDERYAMLEDMLFVNTVMDRLGKCAYVNNALYFYRINGYNSTSFLTADKYAQAVEITAHLLQMRFATDNGIASKLMRDRESWRIKYMMAVLEEKPENYKKIIKEEKSAFNKNLKSLSVQKLDRLLNISKLALKFPIDVTCGYLWFLHYLRTVKTWRKKRLWKTELGSI